MNSQTKIFILPTQPIGTNSIVIARGGECAIFDPAGDIEFWVGWLDSAGLRPRAIYLTHGHFDHMLSVADLCEKYSIPWHMNPADNKVIAGNNSLGFLFGGQRIKRPREKCLALPDGARIVILPGLYADVISTPGHTPGGVCFYLQELNLIITGDTLFADTVGRTDLPFGDYNALMRSVQKIKDLALPLDARVIPGHGADTTIARMRLENRFFQ